MATCCSTSCAPAFRYSASSPRRTWRRWRCRRHPDAGALLRPRHCARDRRRSNADLLSATTSSPTSELNDFVAGKDSLEPGASSPWRVPHLYRLMEGNSSTRSLRAFLILLLLHRGEGFRRPRPHAVRRRGAACGGSRSASTRAMPRTAPSRVCGGRCAAPAGSRRGRARDLCFVRGAGEDETRDPRVPDSGQARRKEACGLRRARKGNTLLNYCGIRTDFLDYTVDRSPYKRGKFTPGTRIPILRGQDRADPPRTTSSSCRGT